MFRGGVGEAMKQVVRKVFGAVALIGLLLGVRAHAAGEEQLQIYFVDVEGGQATLIVTPKRETLLIDAGWPGEGGYRSLPGDPAKARDPLRIVAAMRDAGVDRIDYLLVTHFHRDHMGGVPELAQLVPIGTFFDYGAAYSREDRPGSEEIDDLDVAAFEAYSRVRSKGKHLQPKPGKRLPLEGVRVSVVSADRDTLREPLPGAGRENMTCNPVRPSAPHPDDENVRSVGIVLEFGEFRFLDVGDLNGQLLYDLVCPRDLIGEVDVYLVAHHGNAGASDPATIAAFKPRVAVVNNAPRKGGRTPTLQMLQQASGVESWQLHVSEEAGEYNAHAERIANLDEAPAHWLKVVARKDGGFAVINPRTGVRKEY